MDDIGNIDLDRVSSALVACLPRLDAREHRLSLLLYRLLAEGAPIPRATLAQHAGLALENVTATLDRWPLVFSDAEGRVVGYEGLSLPGAHVSAHRIAVGGRTLFAWCAWDTLFLPERLGRVLEITSTSPGEGRAVRLRVTPEQVERAEPAGLCVSFLTPPPTGFGKDVIATFCHFVHFFPSRPAGESWTGQHPGTFLLTLAEAHLLARRVNRALYGDALRPTGTKLWSAP